jgi:hypothetical protein
MEKGLGSTAVSYKIVYGDTVRIRSFFGCNFHVGCRYKKFSHKMKKFIGF